MRHVESWHLWTFAWIWIRDGNKKESVYEDTYNVKQPSHHFFQIQIATKLRCQPFKMQMSTNLVFQAHSEKPEKLEGRIHKSLSLHVIWRLFLIDVQLEFEQSLLS